MNLPVGQTGSPYAAHEGRECWVDDYRRPLDHKNELQTCRAPATAPLGTCAHHFEELTGREADTPLPAYAVAAVPAT